MKDLQKATFGFGCFWCTEVIIERLKGVHSVVSGYAGEWWKPPHTKKYVIVTSRLAMLSLSHGERL